MPSERESAGFPWRPVLLSAVILTLTALPAGAWPWPVRTDGSSAPATRVVVEHSGVIPTRSGLRLTLNTATGNVYVFTDAAGEVRYRVRIEAEGNDPSIAAVVRRFSVRAHRTANGVVLVGETPSDEGLGGVWVTYEIHVPRHYSLAISTQAGDIVTQDIDGQVTLTNGGGNIRVGNIGPFGSRALPGAGRSVLAARLQSAGGHILVGNVHGSLVATTAGGHITAGIVQGDAVLHTGGGHIHVESVMGKADLSTGGGNIVVEHADGGVVAETAGGQIELGEAAGAIRAYTGGGGIQIGRLAGPTELSSSNGRIFLAGVEAPLHASTTTGTITAWLSPHFGGASAAAGSAPSGGARSGQMFHALPGGSELASGQGDIIVYVPRKLAVTIDALVEHGSDYRILADPSLPLKMSYEASPSGRAVRGECALNGGGKVLHLKAAGGNIQLRYLNPAVERQLAREQMEMVAQRLRAQKALLLEIERQAAADAEEDVQGMPARAAIGTRAVVRAAPEPVRRVSPPTPAGPFAEFTQMIEGLWGRMRVSPEDQQKRLIHSVMPEYPDAAREAGIQGDVTLRVLIGRDGTVEDAQPLTGNPLLERSAAHAVEQWRYAPLLIDSRPVSVVTTVTLAFRLH